MAPAQRPRHLPGAGAPRRGGDHLREPAQRHQRRRRPVPQVRQRRLAAGLVDGAAVQPGRHRRAAGGGGQGRPARGLRPPRRGHLPRGRRRVHAAHRLRRLPDPPGRAVADRGRSSTTPRCPTSSTATATATSTSTPPPTSTRPSTSSSTPRPSGPSVCNAAESLLVHAAVADGFLPRAAAALQGAGVELVGDDARPPAASPAMGEATDDDFGREFLALKMSVAVVARPRGGHRPRQPVRHRPHRGHRHRATSPPPAASSGRSTPAPSSSTPRPASPTARSSASAPRSASRTQKLHARGPMAPAGAHHLQVRRVGRRPDQGLVSSSNAIIGPHPRKAEPRHMAERFESVDAVLEALRRVDYLADAVHRRGRLPGRPAGEAGPRGGPGRGRQDRAGQGDRRHDGRPG